MRKKKQYQSNLVIAALCQFFEVASGVEVGVDHRFQLMKAEDVI